MKKVIKIIKDIFYFGLVGIRKKKKWLIERGKDYGSTRLYKQSIQRKARKIGK